MARPVFQSAFVSPDDGATGLGKRPVVFDILGPDRQTSILPDGIRMICHVNPSSMRIQMNRTVERIQTQGGYVEQHWGDGVGDISFENQTGGFARLYAGLSHITNPKYGGTRRETIAHDKYLDMLALFKHNGSVTDSTGRIVLQGIIKVTFDGGVYLGWFSSFSATEVADKPYMFAISQTFTVESEIANWLTGMSTDTSGAASQSLPDADVGQMPLE